MPGLLVSIMVNEGDEVEEGQGLAVIEAMKMENIIKSEKKVKVKKVNCKEGDSLEVDQVILEPIGGAHRNQLKTIESTGDAIEECLNILSNQHGNDLKRARQERYLQIGRAGLFSEKMTAVNSVLDQKYGKIKDKILMKKIIFRTVLFSLLLIISIAILYYLFN